MFLVILIALICITAEAADQNLVVDRPTLTAEDTWNFIYNGGSSFSVTFKKEDKDILVFYTLHQGRYAGIRYQTKDLNNIKLVVGTNVIWQNNPHNGQLNFPLKVGKKWGHNYSSTVENGRTFSRSAFAQVMAWEEIAVPAGTFWAFRIERQNQRSDVLEAADETYWYAPEAKAIVKYDSNEFRTHSVLQTLSLAQK